MLQSELEEVTDMCQQQEQLLAQQYHQDWLLEQQQKQLRQRLRNHTHAEQIRRAQREIEIENLKEIIRALEKQASSQPPHAHASAELSSTSLAQVQASQEINKKEAEAKQQGNLEGEETTPRPYPGKKLPISPLVAPTIPSLLFQVEDTQWQLELNLCRRHGRGFVLHAHETKAS